MWNQEVKIRGCEPLQIVVGKKSVVVIGFEPLLRMHLIQLRSDNLLPKFVILYRHERHTQTSEQRDQELNDAVGVCPGVARGKLDLAQCGCDNEKQGRTRATSVGRASFVGRRQINRNAGCGLWHAPVETYPCVTAQFEGVRIGYILSLGCTLRKRRSVASLVVLISYSVRRRTPWRNGLWADPLLWVSSRSF